MIFVTDNYNFEFSDENEADDGSSGSVNYLRLYCFDKEGLEVASICTNFSVKTSQDCLEEVASNLAIFLIKNSELSVFRALERYVLNFDKSEKQRSRLSDVQI